MARIHPNANYNGKTVIGSGARLKAEAISYGAIRQYQPRPPFNVQQQQYPPTNMWTRRVVRTVMFVDEIIEYRSSKSPLEPTITAIRQSRGGNFNPGSEATRTNPAIGYLTMPVANHVEECIAHLPAAGSVAVAPPLSEYNDSVAGTSEAQREYSLESRASSKVNPHVAPKTLVMDLRRKFLERQVHDALPEETYTETRIIDVHGRSVKGYQCKTCTNINPMLVGAFRRHFQSSIHVNEPQNKCPECIKAYTRHDSVKRHVKKDHPDLWKSICESA